MVEDAIAQTAATAKDLLFDKDGKPKGHDHFLAVLTLSTILRPTTASEAAQPGLDRDLIDWRGNLYTYDADIAVLFLDDAHKGDHTADGVLCNAAAVLLVTTGGIADQRLRMYAAKRLSGEICPPKKGRGGDNAFRDAAIVGLLIPFLLAKGFQPTRNDSTEGECACSILSKALEQIGIDLSGKRLSNLWARRVSKPKQKS